MREWTPPRVVTPEAVPLDFQPAGVGTRMVGFFIDAAVLGVMLYALNFAFGLITTGAGLGLPVWVAVTAVLVLNFLAIFGYPIAMESLNRGRSLGKMIMGLRVVTVEGGPVRFRHSAVRAFMGLVDFLLTLGVGALVSALATTRSQRLGDLVAGTMVLRERTGSGRLTAVTFSVPQGAQAYAETIDPAGLTAQDYQTIRGFLLRAAQLTPSVRADLGRRIAGGLATRVGHLPPPQVAPELFLTCLAARYQQRARPVAAPGWVAPSAEGSSFPAASVPAAPAVPISPPVPVSAGPEATGGFTPPP